MQHNLDEQMHAAELAGLACYARAVLARAMENEPHVLSLRFTVEADPGSVAPITAEVLDATGLALGGFGL